MSIQTLYYISTYVFEILFVESSRKWCHLPAIKVHIKIVYLYTEDEVNRNKSAITNKCTYLNGKKNDDEFL